jgi:hypothetical protein
MLYEYITMVIAVVLLQYLLEATLASFYNLPNSLFTVILLFDEVLYKTQNSLCKRIPFRRQI